MADMVAPMGRTTIQISDELADELHDRKDRGDSYEDVIWRNLDTDPGDENEAEVGTDDEQDASGDTLRDEMKATLADLSVPGRPAAVERTRRDAIVYAWERLREEGEMPPSRLADDVMGQFFDDDDLGYSVSKQHPGYQLLDNVLRDTVRELPGVHSTGRVWQFRGDSDE